MKASTSPAPNVKTAAQEIDDIIKQAGDWRGKKLAELRAVIRQADPAVVEEVKWKKPSRPEGVPVWSHDGIICVADTLKNAVRLTFPKGAAIKDPKKLLAQIALVTLFLLPLVSCVQWQASPTTQMTTTETSGGTMEAAMELAGFFTAHAVWSVSDGETLVPLIGYESVDGKRQMMRLVADQVEEGVAQGKDWLAKNPAGAIRAVLVYDGFITLESGKTDALIVTVRDYTQRDGEITLAIPYRHARDPKGFAVHRPKFVGFKGEKPNWEQVGEALWRGIEKHAQGAQVWNNHLDESK